MNTAAQDAYHQEIARQLGQTDFFRGLEGSHRLRLAALSGRRRLAKNQVLFREGAPGSFAYLLLSGTIQLAKTSSRGGEIVIRTFSSTAFFGEVVLFENNCYPVTARAVTPAAVCSFPAAGLRRLLDERAFREAFIAALMRRQRYLADRLREQISASVEERFFRFLHEQFGSARRMRPAMPKKQIAAAIGVTPETFSRLINDLQQRGVIAWQGKELRILQEGPSDAGSPVQQ